MVIPFLQPINSEMTDKKTTTISQVSLLSYQLPQSLTVTLILLQHEVYTPFTGPTYDSLYPLIIFYKKVIKQAIGPKRAKDKQNTVPPYKWYKRSRVLRKAQAHLGIARIMGTYSCHHYAPTHVTTLPALNC